MEKIVKDIEKGQDLLRISLSEFKGGQYVNIRIHYMDDKGDWKPTRKGVTLTPGMMKQVYDAIGEALNSLGDTTPEEQTQTASIPQE